MRLTGQAVSNRAACPELAGPELVEAVEGPSTFSLRPLVFSLFSFPHQLSLHLFITHFHQGFEIDDISPIVLEQAI